MVRIFHADPHPIVRAGIREIFRGTEIELTGEASTINEALLLLPRHMPDLLLTEIRFPEGDATTFLQQAASLFLSPLPIVVFSACEDPAWVARAALNKVRDYIVKSASPELLLFALRSALNGTGPVAEGRLRRVTAMLKGRHHKSIPANPVPKPLLTPRETEVLRHIALGLSNKEIANILGISVETIKEHVRNLLRKTGRSDRTQAAVWGLRCGLIEYPTFS